MQVDGLAVYRLNYCELAGVLAQRPERCGTTRDKPGLAVTPRYYAGFRLPSGARSGKVVPKLQNHRLLGFSGAIGTALPAH